MPADVMRETRELAGDIMVHLVPMNEYDFSIDEEFRQQGYGTQALMALEVKVKEFGLDKIALHVFAHNHAARALYEKTGFEITSIYLAKNLM